MLHDLYSIWTVNTFLSAFEIQSPLNLLQGDGGEEATPTPLHQVAQELPRGRQGQGGHPSMAVAVVTREVTRPGGQGKGWRLVTSRGGREERTSSFLDFGVRNETCAVNYRKGSWHPVVHNKISFRSIRPYVWTKNPLSTLVEDFTVHRDSLLG